MTRIVSRRRVLQTGLASAFPRSMNSNTAAGEVTIVISPASAPRVVFGAEWLRAKLGEMGFRAEVLRSGSAPPGRCIIVGNPERESLLRQAIRQTAPATPEGEEGFLIATGETGKNIFIAGEGCCASSKPFSAGDAKREKTFGGFIRGV